MNKKHRLLKNFEFKNIIRSGNKIHSYNFLIYYKKNNLSSYRIGITVSKKISKLAVVRNLIRRRIKAAINDIKLNERLDLDIVIITKAQVQNLSYLQIKKELNKLLVGLK